MMSTLMVQIHPGHPAANQKNPLRHPQKSGKPTGMPNPFHNTLMQKRLTNIPIKKWKARNPQSPRQKTKLQKRFFPPKPTNIIQIQLMHIHHNHA